MSKEKKREENITAGINMTAIASQPPIEFVNGLSNKEFDRLGPAISFNASHIRAAFESGAAWQREHHYSPNAMNAVEAHKEALARWLD
jgi:hypothetical protein